MCLEPDCMHVRLFYVCVLMLVSCRVFYGYLLNNYMLLHPYLVWNVYRPYTDLNEHAGTFHNYVVVGSDMPYNCFAQVWFVSCLKYEIRWTVVNIFRVWIYPWQKIMSLSKKNAFTFHIHRTVWTAHLLWRMPVFLLLNPDQRGVIHMFQLVIQIVSVVATFVTHTDLILATMLLVHFHGVN